MGVFEEISIGKNRENGLFCCPALSCRVRKNGAKNQKKVKVAQYLVCEDLAWQPITLPEVFGHKNLRDLILRTYSHAGFRGKN
jgi:hypothetical protein